MLTEQEKCKKNMAWMSVCICIIARLTEYLGLVIATAPSFCVYCVACREDFGNGRFVFE